MSKSGSIAKKLFDRVGGAPIEKNWHQSVSRKGMRKIGSAGRKQAASGVPLTAEQEEQAKVGPLKENSCSGKKLIQAQRSFAEVVEMRNEQKWVQQMRSVRLAPDAECQELA
jgi:hypothetical protein